MQQLQELQVRVRPLGVERFVPPHSRQADEKRLEAQQKEMAAELARMREALVRNSDKLEEVPGGFALRLCSRGAG